MRVAIYCRVAREYNDELEQQKDPLRTFAENNGIPLTTVTDPLKFYDWLRTNKECQAPDKKFFINFLSGLDFFHLSLTNHRI